MTEWKTMRVPEAAWESAQAARGDGETWGEYLRRCADAPRVEMTEDEVRSVVRELVDNDALE